MSSPTTIAHEPGVKKPDPILVVGGVRRTFGVLLAVAGFAFARFQLSGASRVDRVAHSLESATRIAVPGMVWMGVLFLSDERYSWWNPLLLTSVGGGNVHAQWRYWFVVQADRPEQAFFSVAVGI